MSHKNEKVQSGIKCHAVNCIHHCAGDGCDAKCICVDNRSAVTEGETCCSTFQLK